MSMTSLIIGTIASAMLTVGAIGLARRRLELIPVRALNWLYGHPSISV